MKGPERARLGCRVNNTPTLCVQPDEGLVIAVLVTEFAEALGIALWCAEIRSLWSSRRRDGRRWIGGRVAREACRLCRAPRRSWWADRRRGDRCQRRCRGAGRGGKDTFPAFGLPRQPIEFRRLKETARDETAPLCFLSKEFDRHRVGNRPPRPNPNGSSGVGSCNPGVVGRPCSARSSSRMISSSVMPL